MSLTTKYGFKVGQNVFTKVELLDENNNFIPENTLIRIVDIAPKVRNTNPLLIKGQPRNFDNKEYFYNAVLATQENDYSNRIRANFVTIGKQNMITPKHLKNAFSDGVFYLPRHATFWAQMDKNYYLSGEMKEMCSELACKPIAIGEKGKSLLLCLTDIKGKEWYSWFHAESN
jgi:hypothetical protein